MKYKNIVWDWNGTLLDDVQISVDTINRMLRKKRLDELTVEKYKAIFGFPVKEYYEGIGYDFNRDDWEAISLDFVDTYGELSKDVVLTSGVNSVLSGLKECGVRQYVLSALQEDLLEEMLERFGIRDYFEGVCGSDNIYADGKVARGERMLQVYPIDPRETLMVGDTLHDAEVAEALGFDIRLYVGGHNSAERLREKGIVLERMEMLLGEVS
jgi:haloacid dehalogenase domain protein hydrolase